MHRSGAGGLDVGALLAKVEACPPSDAVPAVADALAEMVGAREVSFLIADFSGRAVVRLTSAGPVEGARSLGVDQAEQVPLRDTVYGRVLRTQQADVQRSGDDVRLVDWFGGQPRDRNTEHEADPDRASPSP